MQDSGGGSTKLCRTTGFYHLANKLCHFSGFVECKSTARGCDATRRGMEEAIALEIGFGIRAKVVKRQYPPDLIDYNVRLGV